jgi:hypothetical protein
MALLPEDTSVAETLTTQGSDELKRDISGYVAEMTRNLKALSLNAELDVLAYLLSIAEEEARGVHRTHRSAARPHGAGNGADHYPVLDASI